MENTITTHGVEITRTVGDAPSKGVQTLRVARDQSSQWADLGRAPMSLDQAIEVVRRTADADGRRVDLEGVCLEDCKADVDPDTGQVTLRRSHGGIILREHAFGQVCSAVGAPPAYLRTLPQSIALDALNHGLKHRGNVIRKFRLADRREAGGKIEARAMVSARFAPLDDSAVLPQVREALAMARIDARVTALAVGDVTVLRMTVGETPMQGEDPLRYGFDLRNGEIGNASISLTSMIYRLVCTNGMRAMTKAQATRWRHIGAVSRLYQAFRDALPETLAHTREVARLCNNTRNRVLSVADIRTEFARLDMSKAQQKEAVRLALAETNRPETVDGGERLTLWDAINGVTASARPLAHQARLHVEEQAGRLLHVAA